MFARLRDIFQCDRDFSDNERVPLDKKYALVISVMRFNGDISAKDMGFDYHIEGLLLITECPLMLLSEALKNTHKDDLIGVHFSNERCLDNRLDQIDIDQKFFDSMKAVISKVLNPKIFAKTFQFNELIKWDDQLNMWVKEFNQKYGYYPNIL